MAIHQAAWRENLELTLAIITRYHAQVKLLRAKIRELADDNLWHVIALPLGRFINFKGVRQVSSFATWLTVLAGVDWAQLRGATGIRLVNVAITRAKGKVILSVNLDWCNQHKERGDNPLLWDVIKCHTVTILVPVRGSAATWCRDDHGRPGRRC